MKTLFAALTAVAFLSPAFAGDPELNANCCCGKPVDKAVEAVTVKVGDAEHKIGVCSAECGEAVKKMDAVEAWKAVKAHNKGPKAGEGDKKVEEKKAE